MPPYMGRRGRMSTVIVVGLFGVSLVELYGPAGQRTYVNPDEVSTVREPVRRDAFAPGTRCVVVMHNGNIIASIEACDVVIRRLR